MNYIRNEVYPYTVINLKADFPNVGFPKNPLSNESIRNEYGIYEVAETTKPTQAGFYAVEGMPEKNGEIFSQTWSLEKKNVSDLLSSDITKTSPEVRDGYKSFEGEPEFVDGEWRQTWQYTVMDWLENRIHEYGDIVEQVEFITENGLEAWQTKVAEIKAKYPKS